MPAATISSFDGAPRRIPKLAVRNRIPEAEVIDEKTSLIDTRRDSKMRPPLSSCSSEQTLSPSLVRRPSNLSQVEDGARGPSGRERSGSIASTTTQSRSQRVPTTTKKKGSGVLSFLTLREPSTSAWEEYANAQKKAASGKSSRTAQKLPAFVPATNSKWDGLPESAKRASMQSKRDGSKRFSTFSNASKQTGRTMGTSYSDNSSETSSARRYGSLSSKPSKSQSHSVPGSVHSRPSTEAGKKHSIPTTTTNTTLHPAHRNTAVTPWDEPPDLIAEDPEEEDRQSSESAQTFLHPPSPTLPELDPLSSLPTPELELPELLRPADYITTPEHSPRTPPADFALNLIDAIAQTQMDNASKPEQPQSPVLGTFWHSDTDTETESIKTGRPLSTNFSRPVLGRFSGMALIPEQSLPDEPASEDDGEEEEEEEEDARAFQSTLRDATGRTSPFCFETTTLLARPVIPDRTSSQGFEGEGLGGKFSPGARVTGLTVTTAVVAGAPPLLSPTFSPRTLTATRPTMAVTETETEREDDTEEEREDTPTRLTSDPFPSHSPPRSNSSTPSLAPSEISLQWTKTPKERLGLGSRLSRIRAENDVLPWEVEHIASSAGIGKRASGMTEAQARRQSGASQMTVGEGGGKLRRLSLRLGRKG
ncbi:hypothetical protein LTR78_004632 [Recurvomyces mirabilis]|uniref:Uncharacterized protein n=1 Tax=Recurvomyces mirabilis TaxID=574656 RepID=A0AAE1C2J5_9PEZI|nr:hypothetical protein LTR78_004632 [Recurvomyces mirabilis]KAK5152875.1 hypothetical protein LTS14_007982 [Recurvomyces mirabilis]